MVQQCAQQVQGPEFKPHTHTNIHTETDLGGIPLDFVIIVVHFQST